MGRTGPSTVTSQKVLDRPVARHEIGIEKSSVGLRYRVAAAQLATSSHLRTQAHLITYAACSILSLSTLLDLQPCCLLALTPSALPFSNGLPGPVKAWDLLDVCKRITLDTITGWGYGDNVNVSMGLGCARKAPLVNRGKAAACF